MALIFGSSIFCCVGRSLPAGRELGLLIALVARTDLDAVLSLAGLVIFGVSNLDGLQPIISLHDEVRCSSLSQLVSLL